MSDLPKRPRQHELEDASRRAFARALPDAWVYRDVHSDYGLDSEVEIFEEGRATGLFFSVQLRSTDDVDNTTMRFSKEQWAYFNVVDRPVLLVRYLAATDVLLGEWVHRANSSEADRSVSVRLSPDAHLLSPKQFPQLAREVRAVRTIRDRVIGYPLLVSVRTSSGDASAWCASLRARLGPTGIVRFVDTSDTVVVAVVTGSEVLVEAGPERFSAPIADDLNVAAADVLVATAIVAARIGLADAAVAMARAAVPEASLTDTQLFDACTPLTGTTLGEITAVCLGIANAGRPETALRYFGTCTLICRRSTTTEDAAPVAEFWEAMITGPYSLQTASRARAEYSFANHLFSQGEYAASADHYGRALELDPAYRERAYFCREFAAAEFEAGHYQQAVDWYERSSEIEPAISIAPRIADCLQNAGLYREALSKYDEYFDEVGDDGENVWYLQAWAIAFAVDRTGIERQDRYPAAAERALKADGEGNIYPSQLTPQDVDLALQADLLFPGAWVAALEPIMSLLRKTAEGQRGDTEWEAVDPVDSWMIPLVLTMVDGDEIWFTMCGVQAAVNGLEDLLNRVVRYGVARHGAAFATALFDLASSLDHDDQQRVRAAIAESLDEPTSRVQIIRIHDDAGDWEELEVGFWK